MAETKLPIGYQIKHVDGVMHLSMQAQAEAPIAADKLRVQPPSIEEVD